MDPRNGVWLTLLAGLIAVSTVRAQDGLPLERPQPAAPARPLTERQRDRHEAERLYALGLLQERDSRLVEATRTYEQALKLDPDSTLLRRALVPLYVALDRSED